MYDSVPRSRGLLGSSGGLSARSSVHEGVQNRRASRPGIASLLMVLGLLCNGCVWINDYDGFFEATAGDGGMDGGSGDAGISDGGTLEPSDARPRVDGCTPTSPPNEVCNGVDDDCDGDTDESPTECAAPGALTACQAGSCAIVGCAPGLGDCDAAPDCETDLAEDRGNCGGCGTTCAADEVCRSEACELVEPRWVRLLPVGQMVADRTAVVVVSSVRAGGGSRLDRPRVSWLNADTGTTDRTATFDPGSGGFFIAATSIAAVDGNVYVAGVYDGQFTFAGVTSLVARDSPPGNFLAAYAPDGTERFLVTARAESTGAVSSPTLGEPRISADRAGNLYLSSTFTGALNVAGTVMATSSSEAAVVARFDASGGVAFANTLAFPGVETLALDAAGGLLHLVGGQSPPAVLAGRTFGRPDKGLRAAVSLTDGSLVRVFENGDSPGQTRCTGQETFTDAAVAPPAGGVGAQSLWVAVDCRGFGNYGDAALEGRPILVAYDALDDTHRRSFRVASSGVVWHLDASEGLIAVGGPVSPPLDLGLGPIERPGVVAGSFLAAYDLQGRVQWGTVFGGANFEGPTDVEHVSTVGRAVFAAGQTGAVDFDYGAFTLTADRGFVLRIDD